MHDVLTLFHLDSSLAEAMEKAMWTLQDAKNKFSAVVDEAMAGRPQEVTKRGKPAVIVISSDEYARLVEAAGPTRVRFSEHLLSFPLEEQIERAKTQPREIAF